MFSDSGNEALLSKASRVNQEGKKYVYETQLKELRELVLNLLTLYADLLVC